MFEDKTTYRGVVGEMERRKLKISVLAIEGKKET